MPLVAVKVVRNTHGITDYTKEIPGERGNHNRPMVFDFTDGFIGITAFEEPAPKVGRRQNFKGQRVLMSPDQFEALIEFVQQKHPRRSR